MGWIGATDWAECSSTLTGTFHIGWQSAFLFSKLATTSQKNAGSIFKGRKRNAIMINKAGGFVASLRHTAPWTGTTFDDTIQWGGPRIIPQFPTIPWQIQEVMYTYYHLRSTVRRERFFAYVYFSNEIVSQTTVSTGPMKMFRLEHEAMNVCQRNVARFGHVECMFDKIKVW